MKAIPSDPQPLRERSRLSLAERALSVDTRFVEIEAIDREDRRFQLRLVTDYRDLKESLRTEGQQTPVLLWGRARPYKIIDGFRRIDAMVETGYDRILAFVRSDLDQTQALTVSFLANAKRKNLTPLDKAHAVWKSIHEWQMSKAMVAKNFALSVRQVDRYLVAFEFDETLKRAIREDRITMAHAALLHRAQLADPNAWVKKIVRHGLSCRQLKARLRQRTHPSRRRYLIRGESGFQLRALRYRQDMSPEEKRRIREALETALELLRKDSASQAGWVVAQPRAKNGRARHHRVTHEAPVGVSLTSR
jgi:ParB/RepB/Spo0J family partition protein